MKFQILLCLCSVAAMLQAQVTGTVTDYDGNVYATVKIGNQWWMAENLRTTHYADGTAIAAFSGTKTTSADDYKAYYAYPNGDADKAGSYGLLYSWGALCNQSGTTFYPLLQGDWAVPDTSDWAALSNYLGGKYVAGGKLKKTTAEWGATNTGATDEVGFHALPSGDLNTGGYTVFGTQARYWTPRLVESTGAGRIYMYLSAANATLEKGQYRNVNALSLRLILKNTTAVATVDAAKLWLVASSEGKLEVKGCGDACEVTVCNVRGEQLMCVTFARDETKALAIGSLASGVYIGTVRTNGGVYTHKFFKY